MSLHALWTGAAAATAPCAAIEAFRWPEANVSRKQPVGRHDRNAEGHNRLALGQPQRGQLDEVSQHDKRPSGRRRRRGSTNIEV